MKLIEVYVVAPPRNLLAIDCKNNSRNLVGRSLWTMGSWNPLRRGEGQRPGGNRQIDLGVIKFARRVRQIGSDLNWRLLCVSRWNDAGKR